MKKVFVLIAVMVSLTFSIESLFSGRLDSGCNYQSSWFMSTGNRTSVYVACDIDFERVEVTLFNCATYEEEVQICYPENGSNNIDAHFYPEANNPYRVKIKIVTDSVINQDVGFWSVYDMGDL